MGQEIVYCFKCQKRILGADYAKGHAFQLENNSCCSTCAVQVLDTLPPKAKEQLLGKMFKATHEHQSAGAPSKKAMSASSPASSTRRIPVQPGPARVHAGPKSSAPFALGIGAAVVATLLFALLMTRSSGPPPQDPVPPTAKIKPTAPVTPPSEGPSPEEKRRSDAAKEALRKARVFADANPRDYEGQTREWKGALLEAERTGYEAEARRELDRIQVRAKEAAAQEIADLGREVRKSADRKEFKAALEMLARERPRHATTEWSSALEGIERDVRAAADRLFAELKAKAVAARDRGAQDEVAAARAEVARWGIAELVSDLNAALEFPWLPIFDGRTLNGFPASIGNAWRVQDGQLIHDNAVNNAAVTLEAFGDGEIRFRFEVSGATRVSFRFRLSTTGSCWFDLEGQALATLPAGEHELLFTGSNDVVTVTLDGKAKPVEKVGQSRSGYIQFNSIDGSCRIKSLDFRKLR